VTPEQLALSSRKTTHENIWICHEGQQEGRVSRLCVGLIVNRNSSHLDQKCVQEIGNWNGPGTRTRANFDLPGSHQRLSATRHPYGTGLTEGEELRFVIEAVWRQDIDADTFSDESMTDSLR